MIIRQIQVARGTEPADLVLKNGAIVNVFTEALEQADVAICGDRIVGIGMYDGKREIDCTGRFIAPAFLDGHMHLESTMLCPVEFARAVLPHGTSGVIADPHEIANVCGKAGIEYMLSHSEGLPVDIFFALSSCVPATAFDESGAYLTAEDLLPFYQNPRVLALAEVMDYVGVLDGKRDLLQKIVDARSNGRAVDGHAPGLTGKDLCGYLTAGVQSDHECSRAQEAIERIARGQWVMVRQGTAAKNLAALMPLFARPYCERAMLATDDRDPSDLLREGHIDGILRQAVALGADPCIAIKMGSFNTAQYFGLSDRGAVAPGYRADLVVLRDLESFQVERVYHAGAERYGPDTMPQTPITPHRKAEERVTHSFRVKHLTGHDFCFSYDKKDPPKQMRVICLQKGQLLTEEVIIDFPVAFDGVCKAQDICKLAVIERHKGTGHIGLGLLQGYGLKEGAIASSVAHDSHNLIVAGVAEEDMAAAANAVCEMQGGWAIACGGKIAASLALPIAGLMSESPAEIIAEQVEILKKTARSLGVGEGIDPFMTLAFLSLPVIPKVKLTTRGLIDVQSQTLRPVLF